MTVLYSAGKDKQVIDLLNKNGTSCPNNLDEEQN